MREGELNACCRCGAAIEELPPVEERGKVGGVAGVVGLEAAGL